VAMGVEFSHRYRSSLALCFILLFMAFFFFQQKTAYEFVM